jgi:DNA polymerase III alpha subunit
MTSNIIKSQETELYTWFRLENSLNSFIKQRLSQIPPWALDKGISSTEDLHVIYRDRLIYEFNVIKKMHFLDYFLIVADLLDYCRDQNIPTGAGRGSAAGSLLAFLLKITKVDPIKYDLLFERFINPDRVTMPDVDLDISQSLRHLAKEYLSKKYGHDKTSSIGTFSRMKVRAAVKDIVRSLNVMGNAGESFKLADKISKTLEESEENVTYSEALKDSSAFRDYMNQYPIIARHVQNCENVLRQVSTHAAGVLISAEPLNQEIPLIVDKKGLVLTAYDGKTIEKLGYLKLDTLGLKNLDTIADCRANIKRLRGSIPKMELEGIEISPGEDPKRTTVRIAEQEEVKKLASMAYKYLREKSTLGIFQCEQSVTQELLRKAETNSIGNIADILALIRPGPRKAGSTEVYIARKRGDIPEQEWYTYKIEQLPKQVEDTLNKCSSDEERSQLISEIKKHYEAILHAGVDLHRDDLHSLRQASAIGKDEKFIEFLDIAPSICSWLSRLEHPDKDFFNLDYLAPICKQTQGLPLFQEQLMQIAVRCAGFTRGQSDTLRKGVGKKDAIVIKKISEQFIAGMCSGGELNTGMTASEAQFVWYKFILPYGSYGFNLSHSIAYGFTTYETAWLKANFPGEFYAALLSHEDKQDKVNLIISEAKTAGIKFLPPDVNESTSNFKLIDTTTIVYSLTCMKGVGESAVDKIIAGRPYKHMIDFIGRAQVNSSVTNILIKSGAFDLAFKDEKISRKNYFDFFDNCRTKLKRQTDRLFRDEHTKKWNYPNLKGEAKKIAMDDNTYETQAEFHNKMMEKDEKYKLEYEQGELEEVARFQYDWTGPVTITSKGIAEAVTRTSEDDRSDWSQEEHLDAEEEIFGTPLSGHRLDAFSEIEKRFIINAEQNGLKVLNLTSDLNLYEPNDEVYIFCLGYKFLNKFAYKKDNSQFTRNFEIEDRNGKSKLTVFEKTYRDLLKRDSLSCFSILEKLGRRPVMILKCKINEYAGRRSIALEAVVEWVNDQEIKQDIQDAKQRELA